MVGLRTAAAVGSALLCLAGCAGSGSDRPDDPDGPAGSPTGADEPTPAAETVPPQLRECSAEPPPELANLTWTVPDGFAEASGLTQIAPLEPEYSASYFMPQQPGTGVEVLVVVHYPQLSVPLTDDCGEVDGKQVDAYLAQWHEEAGITASDQHETEVAGVPAIREQQQYADHDFTVDSTFLIGAGELLMISCQWTGQEDVIGTGCEELLDSVTTT